MLSVLSQPIAPVLATEEHPPVELRELVNIEQAIEPFVSLYRRTGEAVRLHCVIPTSCSSETCTDLHDLNDLRVRSLVYVHQLLEALRSSEVPASYKLCSSTLPLSICVVCAAPSSYNALKLKTSVCEAIQNTKFCVREKALLADLPYPALVIT